MKLAKIEPSELHVEDQAAIAGRKSSRTLWNTQTSSQDEVAQVKQIQSASSKQTDILPTYQSVDSDQKLPPEHHVKGINSTRKHALVPDLSPQQIPATVKLPRIRSPP